MQASLPAGSTRRAAGCAPACSRPPFRFSVASLSRSPLAAAQPLGSPPARRPPPGAVHSHSARPLCSPRAASRSAAAGSSAATLPGEPPGERQGSGRIINHPQPSVPSARWFAPCAPGSSCTIAGSAAPRGSEGKRKRRGNNPETFLLDCAQVREGSSLVPPS